VAASDLDIVSTMTLEAAAGSSSSPASTTNTMELREARLKIGSGAVRWSFGRFTCRLARAVAPRSMRRRSHLG